MRRLLPFLAAAASGSKVTFDRTAETATIDGTTYDTSDPVAVALPTLVVRANNASVFEGVAASWTIGVSPAPTSNLGVGIRITQSGSYVRSSDAGTKGIIFRARQSTQTYTVNTTKNTANDADGTVTLAILMPNVPTYQLGSPSSASITITNIVVPTLSITSVSSSIAGGQVAAFTIAATPTPNMNFTTLIRVTPSVVGFASMTQNNPYISQGDRGNKSLTFRAGQTSETYSITTETYNDRDPGATSNGSVTVSLRTASASEYVVGTPNSAQTAITETPMTPSAPATRSLDSSSTLTLTPTPQTFYSDMSIDSSDRFWCLTAFEDSDRKLELHSYSTTGSLRSSGTVKINVPINYSTVGGFNVNSDGTFLVCMYVQVAGSNPVRFATRVEKYPSSGGSSTQTISLPSSIVNPNGIDVDSEGSIWVADRGTLHKFNSSGTEQTSSRISLNSSNQDSVGLAIDDGDNFWTLDSRRVMGSSDVNRIFRYTQSGTFTSGSTINLNSAEFPTGISYDSDGNLWLLTTANKLRKYI